MRLPRIRSSIPSLIITVFVLGLLLAFIVDLRERARRKVALRAAQAAYRKARSIREAAESRVAHHARWRLLGDAEILIDDAESVELEARQGR